MVTSRGLVREGRHSSEFLLGMIIFLAIDWAPAVSSPRDKALCVLPGYCFVTMSFGGDNNYGVH